MSSTGRDSSQGQLDAATEQRRGTPSWMAVLLACLAFLCLVVAATTALSGWRAGSETGDSVVVEGVADVGPTADPTSSPTPLVQTPTVHPTAESPTLVPSTLVPPTSEVLSSVVRGGDDQPATHEPAVASEVPVDPCDNVVRYVDGGVSCSGRWAVSFEPLQEGGGWHLLERNALDMWSTVDFRKTCCEERELSLDLMLQLHGVARESLEDLCSATKACEPTAQFCGDETADSEAGAVVGVSEWARLRIGPSTSYPQFDLIDADTRFRWIPDAVTFNEGRNWVLIRVNESACVWLAGEFAGDAQGRPLGTPPS